MAETPVPVPAPARRVSGPVTPHAPRWHQRLAASLIYASERAVSATFRLHWENRCGKLPEPAIYCLWHNRLAVCMYLWRCYRRQERDARRLAALISASKDGALLAATLERFGVVPVRGSSSRRGAQALVELTSILENGCNVAITPDGPRGPRYQVRPGVVALAQMTGAPIVPVAANLRGKISFRSWDRFQLPLPFASGEIILGEPLRFPKTNSDEEREQFRRQLEERMLALTRD